MNALRKVLSKRLHELGVEERPWPGRATGVTSLFYHGKEFAHFHTDCEIDIRLGKDVIKRERLKPLTDSTAHPTRAKSSPWYEFRILSRADVQEALRLAQFAIGNLKIKA